MAVATRRSKYGSLNWEDHEPTLKRLYLDQDMTLADVADIMKRNHNFAPSVSAYKRAFAARGWRKNSTAKVARSMESSARKRQRESEKEAVFELGGQQLATTEVEQVAARTKRTRTATRVDVSKLATPIGVTYETPRDSTELPVPGVSGDFRPEDSSPAASELNQETDALAMVADPITHGVNTAAGPSELTNNRINKHCNHGLNRWACGGASTHQSGPDPFLCPTARDVIFPDLSQEGQDISTSWNMDEHPSPAGADMFREPLDLDQHDLSTPRQTHELLSPNVLFLESHRLFSPPLTILPDRLMTGSRFAMKLIGSPWSLFQSVLHSTRSINADTSMPPLQVPRGTDAGDIQPSLYDLAYSMLPHSSSSIAAKNLGSALELIVSTYFPADEAQRLQYVPAFSRNSFIEQLVTTAFGMVANGVLANEGIEQFLNILKNYTPRPLLRRIFESETSTARAALEMLLKDVVTRGDEEALDFLLALGIRKEHLSGSVGGKLLQYFVPFGKTNMTKRIVLAGADPNVGEDWRNPLVRAAWERDLELVEILLKAGAEDNHRFKESRSTALSRAVVNNHRRCVSLLLESGATVDTCIVDDIKGWESGCDEPPTLSAVDYAYLVGYTQVHQLLLVRSAKAKSHLTISGIISAARAGLNSLEAYLEKRAYDNAKEQTTLLQNALSSAIRHNTGDPAIYVLLDFGVDPDTPTLTLLDQLPLCQAIPDNRLVRRLLDAGANLENPQIILAAADYENIDCLGLLIMNGLNLQTLGSIGLGEAILSGNVDIMKVLLHFGAPAGGYDIMGSSLVAVAAENGNREALHLLLQHGADVNDGGSDSRRPINSAVVKGDLEMVKILVENGALLDHPGLRDKRCRTVLEEWASEVDELRISDLFTFLLERGAPVNAPEVKRCAPHWNSLLTTLILNSAEDDLIRQVLEKGAHVNDRLPTVGGARTPIQAAAEMGKIDLVREFHEKGADINAPPGFRLGRTALQAACSARQANMEVVVYLLDNKVDINAKAGYDGGLTAIQGAASHGNIELVSLLLDRGADLNAEAAPMNGRTALEGAAEHGRLDMVYLLLNAGAKCQREGTTGYDSAVELAKEEGHWEIARLLSSFGGVAS